MRHHSTQRILDFIVRYWPPLVIIAFIFGLHWDLVVDAIPATGDHMIHLYRGWHMAEHMLPSGRLTGWSNMAFTGYPAGVYYPILGDLLIAGFRYLTFGLLTWERTYAVGFLFLLVAMPLSVYFIAKRAVGQTGSVVAAVLCLGDVGGWPQGGHYSTVHWAVWPFMLGLTLTMFAIGACEKALATDFRKQTGPLLVFALLLALTVLAHPMTVFFIVLAGPLFVTSFAIANRHRIPWHWVLGRGGVAAGIGVVLTLFWTVPWFVSGKEWTHGWPSVGFGGLWMPLGKMVSALATNELFKNFHPIAWVLGLVGTVLGLFSRRLWPTFLALLLIAAFVGTGLCYDLGDSVISRKVQIERMAAFMKFVWFALAGLTVDRLGFGLEWAFQKLPAAFRAKHSTILLHRAFRTLAGLLLVVFLTAIAWDDSFGKVAQIGRLGGEVWGNIVNAENWLKDQPRGRLDRVLYQPGRMCTSGSIASAKCDEVYHRHIFASGPVRTGLPKIKFGYEATAIFRNLPVKHRWPSDALFIRRLLTEPQALVNYHIRWIVSLVDWPKRPDLKEVKRFGTVVIYKVLTAPPEPVLVVGNGKATIEHFEDEYIRIRVTDADEETQVRLPIAYYYPWHAYQDGREIPIQTHGALPNEHQILMGVNARNGVIEFRYKRAAFERVSGFLSLIAWMSLFASLMVLSDRTRSRARGRAQGRPRAGR